MDPAKIQTTVFRLPSTCFAEEDGAIINSVALAAMALEGRRAPRRSQGRPGDHGRHLPEACKEMYKAKDGGAFPDPILNLTWPYRKVPHRAGSSEELAKEYNGKSASPTSARPEGPDQGHQEGRRAARLLRPAEATTAPPRRGCWIFTGSRGPQKGNMMARRDNADPYQQRPDQSAGPGAWPANRRILYNRAAADPSGKPWDPKRKQVWWDGAQGKWVGSDVPDFKVDSAPEPTA